MSSESRPINPEAFADALTALPLASVYSKALELHNSMAHLQRSNAELRIFIEETPDGDKDCEEAITENEGVIQRMIERLNLVKAELEGRGQKLVDVNGTPDTGEGDVNTEDQARSASTDGQGVQQTAPNDRNGGESTSSRPRLPSTGTAESREGGENEAENGLYL